MDKTTVETSVDLEMLAPIGEWLINEGLRPTSQSDLIRKCVEELYHILLVNNEIEPTGSGMEAIRKLNSMGLFLNVLDNNPNQSRRNRKALKQLRADERRQTRFDEESLKRQYTDEAFRILKEKGLISEEQEKEHQYGGIAGATPGEVKDSE